MELNESFIPDEQIRQDYNKIESSPSIDVKREIGAKYGLQRNECSRWQNIAIAILEYLRTIRNHKDYIKYLDDEAIVTYKDFKAKWIQLFDKWYRNSLNKTFDEIQYFFERRHIYAIYAKNMRK